MEFDFSRLSGLQVPKFVAHRVEGDPHGQKLVVTPGETAALLANVEVVVTAIETGYELHLQVTDANGCKSGHRFRHPVPADVVK